MCSKRESDFKKLIYDMLTLQKQTLSNKSIIVVLEDHIHRDSLFHTIDFTFRLR